MDLTIGNYRCFSRESPAKLELRPGATAVVGANNAGKSVVIRFFYEMRGLFDALSRTDSTFHMAAGGVAQPFQVRLADPVQMFSDTNDGDITIRVALRDQPSVGQLPAVDEAVITAYRRSADSRLASVNFTVELRVHGKVLRPKMWNELAEPLNDDKTPTADLKPIRSCFADLAKCFCIGPFRTTQSLGGGMDLDAEIGSSIIQKWKLYKGGGKDERTRAAEISRRLQGVFGLREFDLQVSDVNATRLIAAVDGQSYGLEELGSGLSSFAVAVINLATAAHKPSWVLVDEPENGLHPSLRAEFLSLLASFSTYGVIFATHSYGLARLVSDRIYLVRRDQARRRSTLKPHESVESLAEFLGEIGYSGYRDLGFDKIVLVEGPTDVRTVQELLNILGLRTNAVFLPLGGRDVINPHAEPYLLEVARISKHVTALIDSERNAESDDLGPDQAGFADACARVGIACHVLDRRAIENYFPDGAVKAVFGKEFGALGNYDRTPPGWRKQENWRIASKMTKTTLARTDLGKFLQDL
jgi:ABC-type cobalamin/Fe3+-siderophores transport system ATPase subunit